MITNTWQWKAQQKGKNDEKNFRATRWKEQTRHTAEVVFILIGESARCRFVNSETREIIISANFSISYGLPISLSLSNLCIRYPPTISLIKQAVLELKICYKSQRAFPQDVVLKTVLHVLKRAYQTAIAPRHRPNTSMEDF